MDNIAKAFPFRPYRGLNDNIKVIPYTEGYIYFATDTGNIYMDYQGERISFGGNGAAIYYASDSNVELNKIEDNYRIHLDSLDNPEDINNIKSDDLIINIDGAFYRVLYLSNDNSIAVCNRIAISGSGGGSGDGSGGSTDINKYTEIEVLTASIPRTFVYGKEFKVKVKATSAVDEWVYIRTEITGINGQVYENTVEARSGSEVEIDIGSKMFLGKNGVYFYGSSDNTITKSKKFTGLNVIEYKLIPSPDFNPLRAFKANEFTFMCIPNGQLESGQTSTLKVYITDLNFVDETTTIQNSSLGNNVSVSISNLPHGYHYLKAEMTTTINGREVISNALEYQIAIINESTAPIIWLPYGYKDIIGQYDAQIIEFRAWGPQAADGKPIETHFYKDGQEIASSPRDLYYSDNDIENHIWTIIDHEIGINNYSLNAVGGNSYNITFTTLEDTERDLNIIKNSLVLNLDTKGRSNSENSYSRSQWISNINNKEVKVKFNNFNWYNNGWFNDANNNSFLRISNGASLEIPLDNLGELLSDAKDFNNPFALECRFKLRNVKEYSALVNKDKNINYDSTLGKVIGGFAQLFDGTQGICLGTQETFLKSAQQLVQAKYREEEMISVSYVIDRVNANPSGNSSTTYPLIYIYLNGILSKIENYEKSGESFAVGTKNLIFYSDYCDIDLYNIRIYKGNDTLTSHNVVHNYIADYKDVKAYDLNTIFKNVNNIPVIDFNAMIAYNQSHPDETIMPYMVIESHSSTDLLPYKKGGKMPVDIQFRNPALDYAYSQGLIDIHQYLQGAPSFDFLDNEDESLDVQGTSSQGYPRRNYKWKAKQKKAKWYYTHNLLAGKPVYQYNPETDKYDGLILEDGTSYKKYHLDSSIGETTFCLKADYMESSGTHNTGFASFVATLYENHPLLDYYLNENLNEDLRTTIYGFPILVFQKKKNGEYEFIGRYNFNLDKGATDSCGFTYDIDSKVPDGEGGYKPLEQIAECWEFKHNNSGRIDFKRVDANETSAGYQEVEITKEQFVSNQYYTYNFENDKYELASEYIEGETYYKRAEGTLDILNDFEYRYSYYEDDIDAAINKQGDFSSISQEDTNKFLLDKMDNFIKLLTWINSTDLNPEGGIFPEGENRESRKKKFIDEFEKHLNLKYCIIYFIMTELLHLYDSRGKNLMMASWGPQVEGGEYIWYPIFYDIDTQLGINNSGYPTWDYDVEPTAQKLFSTSNSVLWNNLWECYRNNIIKEYDILRANTASRSLNINTLDGYYNAYPTLDGNHWDSIADVVSNKVNLNSIISYAKIGKRPLMITNIDQYYKYIRPTLQGFVDTSGNSEANDKGNHFYCLQGTRELTRYLYLRNRLNYVDSMWGGGDGSEKTAKGNFSIRITANKKDTTSDKYLVNASEQDIADGYINTSKDNFPLPLDSRGDIEGVRSYLKQYVRFYADDISTEPVYCDGKEAVNIKYPAAAGNADFETSKELGQKLMYVANANYIADLGDLSTKYIDEINFGSLKRLQRLQLGNDYINEDSKEKYYNANEIARFNMDFGFDSNNEPFFGLLNEVILTNINSDSLATSIGFSGCEKLQILRALGTKITNVELPIGTQIHTLHLPNTITGLTLIEPLEALNILSTPGDLKTGFNKGIYIDGITSENPDYTKPIALNTYYVEGGEMGYESYRLLNILYNFKEEAYKNNNISFANKQLKINLKNVDWCPFQQIEYGVPYDSSQKDYYYYDNDRFQLKRGIEETSWESYTLNGKAYILKEEYRNEEGNLDTNKILISDLEMLDTFITRYEIAKNNNNSQENNYMDGSSTQSFSYPEITGIIYVNNEEAYSEADVINKYRKYFPNLTFFFNNVEQSYRSIFVTLIDGVEKIVYTESTTELKSIAYPDVIPSRLNYDFIGWSRDKDAIINGTTIYLDNGTEEFKNKWNNEQRYQENNKNIIKFYAIFELTKYLVEFFLFNPSNGEITQLANDYVPISDKLSEPNIFPYADEKDLAEDMRYKFMGWVRSVKDCYPNSAEEALRVVVDITKLNPDPLNRVFYACFVQESVYSSPTDLKYFQFTDIGEYQDTEDTSYNVLNAVSISPLKGVALKGKITIPSSYTTTSGQVKTVTRITGFGGQKDIYGLFFMEDNKVREFTFNFSASTQLGLPNLRILDWPKDLRKIGQNGLRGCKNLLYDVTKFSNLPLIAIEMNGLTGSFKEYQNIPRFIIPYTVTSLGFEALTFLCNYPGSGQFLIDELIFGDDKNASQLKINSIGNNNRTLVQNGFSLSRPTLENGETPGEYQTIKTVIFYTNDANFDSLALANFMENSNRMFQEGQSAIHYYAELV